MRPRGLPRAAGRLLVSEWVWVAGLVAASAAIRFAMARGTVSPWIFVDELIYSELAKSLAEDGQRQIRDVPAGNAYGLLYPLLLSPAYLLFDRVSDAYEAMKLVNAVVVSLAAVPVYLIGRRLLTPPFALLGAALALAPPALLYSGMLMTENAFYPAFALAALMLVRALERPSWGRTLALVGAIGLAFLVRAQAVALLPAALSAPVLLAALAGRTRVLREHWRLYATVSGAALAAALWYVARGRSPREALGAYAAVSNGDYDPVEVGRWVVYHLAGLDLAVAVAPLAAFGLLAAVARSQPREVQVFVAASVSLFVWLLLQVSAFASLPYVQRVEERNLFHVMPLLFLALLVWVRVGAPRPLVRTAAVVAAVVLLPLALPWERLIGVQALSDTFSLFPWWDVFEAGVSYDRLGLVAALLAGVVAAAFVALPLRLAPLLPLVVFLYLAAEHDSVYGRVEEASAGALFQGVGGERPDWVDAEVGSDTEVAVVWSWRVDYRTVFVNEFFSRSVGPVYYLTAPTPGGLPETPVSVDGRNGRLLDPAGQPIVAPYALTDRTVSLDGEVVARNRVPGSVLLRTDGQLRLSHTVDGVYPDSWSGPTVTYTRFRCRGGEVVATVQSDGGLFREPQVVTATAAGGRTVRFTVPVGATRRLAVPLAPQRSTCVVSFAVSPTAVPAQVQPGATDERDLGLHFLGFRHRP
jgi:hypothetical protein